MKRLTILYDRTCPICVRSKLWMEREPAFLALEFLPCDSAEAAARYGRVPWLKEELVVASDDGRVWIGPSAFLMCLWALREYREWSYRLSGPSLGPLAERFFRALSGNRRRLATWLGWKECDAGTCGTKARPNTAVYR